MQTDPAPTYYQISGISRVGQEFGESRWPSDPEAARTAFLAQRHKKQQRKRGRHSTNAVGYFLPPTLSKRIRELKGQGSHYLRLPGPKLLRQLRSSSDSDANAEDRDAAK